MMLIADSTLSTPQSTPTTAAAGRRAAADWVEFPRATMAAGFAGVDPAGWGVSCLPRTFGGLGAAGSPDRG